jgi:hypothetical protein
VNFKAPAKYLKIGLAMALAVGGLVKGAGASIDDIVAAPLACDQGEIAESGRTAQLGDVGA